jgi:hypothetical protein
MVGRFGKIGAVLATVAGERAEPVCESSFSRAVEPLRARVRNAGVVRIQ